MRWLLAQEDEDSSGAGADAVEHLLAEIARHAEGRPAHRWLQVAGGSWIRTDTITQVGPVQDEDGWWCTIHTARQPFASVRWGDVHEDRAGAQQAADALVAVHLSAP